MDSSHTARASNSLPVKLSLPRVPVRLLPHARGAGPANAGITAASKSSSFSRQRQRQQKLMAVHRVQWTNDGNYALTCGEDRSIRLWNPHRDDLVVDHILKLKREQKQIGPQTPTQAAVIPSALCVKEYVEQHGKAVLVGRGFEIFFLA